MLKKLKEIKIANPKIHKKHNLKQVKVGFEILVFYKIQTSTIEKLEVRIWQNLAS